MAGASTMLRISERAYRCLLNLYPADYRREYGDLMVQTFRDLCREALRQRGVRGLAAVWLHTLCDTAAAAFAEHLDRKRSQPMSTEPGNLLGQPWMLFVRGGGRAVQGDPNWRWDMPRAVEGADSLESLNVPPDRVLSRFTPPAEALEILARLFEVDGRLMPLPTMLFLTENRAVKRDLLIGGVRQTLRHAGAPDLGGDQRPLILVVGSDLALRGEVARLLQESDFEARAIADAKADLPERQADLIVIVA